MHSKPPWTATIHDSVAVVTAADGYAVAHVERGDDRPVLARRRAEYEANAHLIAAAPELFEAAVGALLWLDNLERSVGKDTLLDALPNNFSGRIGLREAIRKATEASDPREE